MNALFLANFNVVDVFVQSDLIGKAIVLGLMAYSVIVWTKMTQKYSSLSRAAADTRRFLYAYSKDAHPLRIFLGHDKFVHSPLFTVYESGCRALMDEVSPSGVSPDSLFKAGSEIYSRRLNATQMEVVHKTIERETLDMALATQEHMGALATATNLAPFLGLFGTVWGVMGTFYGMAGASGALTLSQVAPGVASALLTTVAGLVVAIPSSFAYNALNERIRKLMVQLDNFAGEFTVELKRHYAPEHY